MAKSTVFSTTTAGTSIRSNNGYLQIVNITGAGDAAAVVSIYDNPTAAAGPLLFQAKGTVTGAFVQTAGVSAPGVAASAGLFIVITATTSPVVQVIWE